MAEGLAFELVKEVLDKLGSSARAEIKLLRSFEDDVDDLRSKFSAIRAVLHDAEERSGDEKESRQGLRDWLSKLKAAAYDVDDLLDEIRTHAMQQQHEEENRKQSAKKVCEFILSCANPIVRLKFKREMAHRMKSLRERINKIAIERHNFGLVENAPLRQAEFKRPQTVSVVDEKKIVGRDDDKEKVVKLLLETDGDRDVSVVLIVGMGGLGKTTLAQLAFNDGRIAGQRFDLRVWVCVSTDFDVKTIATPVISEAGETCDLDNPDAVARCLVKIFGHKRFLLVLDDVWNEDQEKWEKLKDLFKDGKRGSKILVTTRSEKVATIMKTVEPHRVKGLSDYDCWTLFKRRAFEEGEENNSPSLVEIGKQIVRKCGGVPLAAKALGGMLRFNRREDDWLKIRDSEIWRLEQESTILPSLKLSYNQMPSALKQCFAYCSIFPKDRVIYKVELIRQWIALGFISSPDASTLMEDIGNGYFDDLVWMSFLQDVENYGNGVIEYRMHDLVHDLAQSAAGDEVAVIVVGEETTRIPQGCRYASIHGGFLPQVPTTVMRRLRALQISRSAPLPTTFYSEAKCLRLLNLQNSGISVLPSSIGKLKLLRYLNLSFNNMQGLPQQITSLRNLQTLNLSCCFEIRKLPKSLGGLANLRVLDLSSCNSLTAIPDSICNLQNLHTLNLRSCEKVMSLEPICHLKNLHYLDLSCLNSLAALPESIGSLQTLRILSLYECNSLLSLPSSLSDLQLLEKLDIQYCEKLCELPEMIQKLTKLRDLLNVGCRELKAMPRGIGKLVSLRELSLFVIGAQDRVEHCASISELEHLRLVGKLRIRGLENVTNPVDAKATNLIEKNLRILALEWNALSAPEDVDTVLQVEEIEIDTVLENLQPHGNLEDLEISGYAGSKFPSWMMNRIDLSLPNLVRISLSNIPRCCSLPPLGQLPFLEELNLSAMPAIKNLGIEFCGDGPISRPKNFPVLTTLHLSRMPMLQEWLTVLTVDDKDGRQEKISIFPCLSTLWLRECPQLRPEPYLPASVEDLLIWGTSKENLLLILERATTDNRRLLGDGDAFISLQRQKKGLQRLVIENCRQLTCLPESMRSLPSLQSLAIYSCDDLERIEDWLGELPELQSLAIYQCRSLRYLPAHKMTALEELLIIGCPLPFDADGRFVDTSVDHIKDVSVDEREYSYGKEVLPE